MTAAHRIHRRELLLGALTGSMLACGGARPTPAGSVAQRQRVVVLGAGIAGLTTAYRLALAGVDVAVLEAQSRVGGRVLTLREPFREDFYVEAGARHVVGEPEMLALMREVGVELFRPTRTAPLPSVSLRGGQRTVLAVGEQELGSESMTAEEQALGFTDRWVHYFGAGAQGDPRSPAWITPELARFDGVDLESFLRAKNASPAFLHGVRDSLGMGEPSNELSALWVMQQAAAIREEIAWGGGGRVVGGTERFPQAIAARLGSRVRLGAIARRVRVSTREVRVGYEQDGALHEIAADRLVVAVHAPAVRSIAFEPGLPQAVHEALDHVRTSSVVRAWVQFDRRVWADAGLSGNASGDDPLGALREETDLPPRTAGVLGIYATGDAARAFQQRDGAAREASVLDLVERAFPGARAHVVNTTVKAWDEDPYARGAYAWMPRDFLTRHQPALTRPAGRIHFAGDYTSYRQGFMHGATASALRVVEEILRSPAG